MKCLRITTFDNHFLTINPVIFIHELQFINHLAFEKFGISRIYAG